MNNPIIEKKRLQIQDSRTREYFDEVLSCYYSGNYRSAIVMLYSTVICDIIYKLNELVNVYGDQKAQAILDEIAQLQSQNPTSAEWERLLIEKCKDGNRILEIPDYSNCDSLQKLRHLCAHPVIKGNQQLYRPNGTIVMGHIQNMLDGVLTKNAYYRKDFFKIFLDDIAKAKNLFANADDLERYITSKFLDKLNSIEDEFFFFKSLWKLVFELDDQDCRDNRFANIVALNLMVKRHKDYFLEMFEREKDYFGRHISIGNDKRFDYLVRFFDFHTEFFAKLPQDVQLAVNNNIDACQDFKSLALFRAANPVAHIFNEKPETEKTAKFLSYYLRENVGSAISLDYNILHYSRSYTYNLGDSRFEEFIAPHVGEFSLPQLEKLVSDINQNSQLYERRRGKNDHDALYNRIMELKRSSRDFLCQSELNFV